MIELWDRLPDWLQLTVAALGWLSTFLGRVCNRLPRHFSIFNRLFVFRGEDEGFVRWNSWTIVAWSLTPLVDRFDQEHEGRGQTSKPTGEPTQHPHDQHPNQPDNQQEQQTPDRGPDDAPNKPS